MSEFEDRSSELRDDIRNAPYLTMGTYSYRVFSSGELGYMMSSELISEVSVRLRKLATGSMERSDAVVGIAPGGHPWALLMSANHGLPLAIARPGLNLPEQYGRVVEITGVPKNQGNVTYFVPHLEKSRRVVIFDDVISSGKTAEAIIDHLRVFEVDVVGFFSIISKNGGGERLRKKYAFSVNWLENYDD